MQLCTMHGMQLLSISLDDDQSALTPFYEFHSNHNCTAQSPWGLLVTSSVRGSPNIYTREAFTTGPEQTTGRLCTTAQPPLEQG